MQDKLIVITDPVFFNGEAEILNQLFEAGLTRLHLRKPQTGKEELKKLITEIDLNFRRFITIHYHPDLVTEMELGGIQYAYPEIPDHINLADTKVSCSLHKWEELKEVQEKIDYCFMSPVFNSISKFGYQANEELMQVPAFARNVYALGGITEANYERLLDNGYSGIAVLGYLWEDKSLTLERFKVLQEKLETYGI